MKTEKDKTMIKTKSVVKAKSKDVAISNDAALSTGKVELTDSILLADKIDLTDEILDEITLILDFPNSRMILSRKLLESLGMPTSVFILYEKEARLLIIEAPDADLEKELAQKNRLIGNRIPHTAVIVYALNMTPRGKKCDGEACGSKRGPKSTSTYDYGLIGNFNGLIPSIAKGYNLSMKKVYLMKGWTTGHDDLSYVFDVPPKPGVGTGNGTGAGKDVDVDSILKNGKEYSVQEVKEMGSPDVLKIVFDKDYIDVACILNMAGISARSIYPDLTGIAKSILCWELAPVWMRSCKEFELKLSDLLTTMVEEWCMSPEIYKTIDEPTLDIHREYVKNMSYTFEEKLSKPLNFFENYKASLQE